MKCKAGDIGLLGFVMLMEHSENFELLIVGSLDMNQPMRSESDREWALLAVSVAKQAMELKQVTH